MLRIATTLLIASFAIVGRASADFIELPASEAVASLPPSAAASSVAELQRDSGYLELGYYSTDGHASSLRRARPQDAGLADGAIASSILPGGFAFSAKWAPLSLAAFLLALAAFVTRRRWSPRV